METSSFKPDGACRPDSVDDTCRNEQHKRPQDESAYVDGYNGGQMQFDWHGGEVIGFGRKLY